MPFKNDPFLLFCRIVSTMVRKGKGELWRDKDSVWVKLTGTEGLADVYMQFSPNDNGIPTRTGGALQIFLNGPGILEGGLWIESRDNTLQVQMLYEDVIADRIKALRPNFSDENQSSVKRLLSLFEWA